MVGLVAALLPHDDLGIVLCLLLTDIQAQVRELQRLDAVTLACRHHLPLLAGCTSRCGNNALISFFGLRGRLEHSVVHEAHETDITVGVGHNAPLLIAAIVLRVKHQFTLGLGMIGAVETVVGVQQRDHLVDLCGVVEHRQLVTRTLHV